MPNGKALTGANHEYRRHGTSILFAALNVTTGQVKAGHYGRRRRREFLDFMNEIVAEHPDEEIHVISLKIGSNDTNGQPFDTIREIRHFHRSRVPSGHVVLWTI